ncbi:hypothetical protein GCM10027418_29930 [Mariniluteicoccus endophyticus]
MSDYQVQTTAVRVFETTLLSKVTGAESTNETPHGLGILGTDLGFVWDAGHDRVFCMFGDTYGEGWGGHGAGPHNADWRRNVLVSSTSRDLEGGGFVFDQAVMRPGGGAAQVIRTSRLNPPKVNFPEHTLIPNGGITVDGVHYVHWMSVLIWMAGGRWRTFQAGIARSDDDGRTWHKPLLGRFPNLLGRNRFQVATFARDDEWVYLIGTTNGRHGSAYLARMRPDEVDRVPAYRYWDGKDWTRSARAAAPIFNGPVGEMSVTFHTGMGKWLAMHLDEDQASIVLRSADQITGPWTAGEVAASAAQYPALYGGYIHPWFLGGDTIYWLMSQWAPYNVFLMKSRIGLTEPPIDTTSTGSTPLR